MKDPNFSLEEAEKNTLRVPHRERAAQIMDKINELKAEGDSAGGIVTCMVNGVPPGLGGPVFDKLDARLAAAMLSLGSAKGIEFGSGFASAASKASNQNDHLVPAHPLEGFDYPPNVPPLRFRTNNAGGMLGGISNGSPIEFKVAFKPVPSISKPQKTVDRSGKARDLVIKGRHDICIVPRAVPVVEAMTALVLADLLLLSSCDQL
jgi:chorismate synthase